jgi:2-methylcitrate dehydratase PrpD
MADTFKAEIAAGQSNGHSSEHLESLSQKLAVRLARQPSAADRERARLHVLDWAACAIAGAVEPGAAEPRALARLEGAGPCRVIGGARSGPLAAALANGPAGALLEMDDVDRRGLLHPGPVVVPAALAAAEVCGQDDGDTLLDAVVRGYEAMIRVGRAVGPHHAARFHVTASCGGFGATAAGASVLGLDETQTAWALGNAGQQAFGLWQVRHEPVFTKALHDGRAAANGLSAAFLARDGYAGPLAIFEGPQGFFHGLCPDGDPQAVVEGGDAWVIHEVSFKPHAACRHAHAAIDAVLALRAQAMTQTGGAALEALEIETYRDAIVFCDRPHPTTPMEGKFSLQHAAAAAWRHGDARLERFTVEALREAETETLRARVSVREGTALTSRYPAHFGAVARVRLADGRVIDASAADALGDSENPMDRAAIIAKARALTAWGGLDGAAAERLIETVLNLGQGAGASDLSAALPGTDA